MALAQCPECGSAVSSAAAACPRCGLPATVAQQALVERATHAAAAEADRRMRAQSAYENALPLRAMRTLRRAPTWALILGGCAALSIAGIGIAFAFESDDAKIARHQHEYVQEHCPGAASFRECEAHVNDEAQAKAAAERTARDEKRAIDDLARVRAATPPAVTAPTKIENPTCFVYPTAADDRDDARGGVQGIYPGGAAFIWKTAAYLSSAQSLGADTTEKGGMKYVAFVSAAAQPVDPGSQFVITESGSGWLRVSGRGSLVGVIGYVEPEACSPRRR